MFNKRKTTNFLIGIFLSVTTLSANASWETGNHVTIEYKGTEVYKAGGNRQLMEIPTFLYKISGEIQGLNSQASNELTSLLNQQLPGSLDLDYAYVKFGPWIDFQLASLGGGQFSADISGLSIYSKADIELDAAPWLANGQIVMTTSNLSVNGNYNLYSGQLVTTLLPPQVNVNVDYGGVGLDLVNFVTFGALDNLIDDFNHDINFEIDQSLDAMAAAKLNSHTTSVFGLSSLIPANLTYHGINISGEVKNLLENTPSGKIISASFAEHGSKYKSRFTLSIGNDLNIVLEHWNPNGTCTRSCRN